MDSVHGVLNLNGELIIWGGFFSITINLNEKRWSGMKVGNDGYPVYEKTKHKYKDKKINRFNFTQGLSNDKIDSYEFFGLDY